MPVHREDRSLTRTAVQSLSSPDALADLFVRLGYSEGTRLPMTAEALSLNQSLRDAVQHVERLTSVDDTLDVYLFRLTSVTVAHTRALARAFRDRWGNFLLVLTDDFRRIDFVLLERELPGTTTGARTTVVRPRVLTVDRTDPDRVALRVLRRFTFTEVDEDGDPDPYAQFDKLKSAFTVAEWSEPFFNNRALFSDYYLNERLPDLDVWDAPGRSAAYRAVRGIFAQARPEVREAPRRVAGALVRPILRTLGFRTETDGTAADRLLYPTPSEEEAGETAPAAFALIYPWHRYLDGKDASDPYRPRENPAAQVVSLLDQEVAPWALVTNGKTWRLYSARAHSRATNYYEIDLEEILAMADPAEAFRYFYLLFRAEAFSPPPEAVPAGEEGAASQPFLDWLMDESTAYARELGERLKTRVFESIFPHFARGFVSGLNLGPGLRGAEGLLALDEDARQAQLQTVFDGTLTFLYRLLFLLYAESRDLLPVREVRGYRTRSLRRIKETLAEKAGPLEDLVPERLAAAYPLPVSLDGEERGGECALYKALLDLFEVIDKGSKTHNVPIYNGGLFQTEPDPDDESRDAVTARFLLETPMPDRYLALGLDRLARDVDPKRGDLGFIDYKSLGVRQLGSIYEGLLEFKIRVAPETMAVVAGAKTEEIVPLREAEQEGRDILTEGRGRNAEPRTLPRGTVYLENDRRERKATGSYYTPDYIVQYIVRHTVGPVLDEKLDDLRPRLHAAEARYRATERRKVEMENVRSEDLNRPALLQDVAGTVLRDLFDVKVLDPAMGSGHFLVEAVDYVTDRLVQFLDGFPFLATFFAGMRESILVEMERQEVTVDPAQLTDVTLLKRHVLKRCIYGVDLNPMAVELAKVSLWLDCFTLGAPLSFLDHHLRCGNSLIGAMAQDVAEAMSGPQDAGQMTFLTGPFVGLLRAAEMMRGISRITDVTLDQVRESGALFKAFDRAARPYKQLLDIHVSQHFGVDRAEEFLTLYGADALKADPEELGRPYREVIEEARDLYEEKRFFHWDLEFPEVFIDLEHAEWKENGGFDAVVGNPPYGVSTGKRLLGKIFPTTKGNSDVYVAFIERGVQLCRENGILSYIVPVTWQTGVNYSKIREHLLETSISKLVNLPYDVFPDAYIDTGILILQKRSPRSGHSVDCYAFVKERSIENLDGMEYSSVQQSLWIDRIILDPVNLKLIQRLEGLRSSKRLGTMTESVRGVLVGREEYVSDSKPDSNWYPYFTEELTRYFIEKPTKFILFGSNLSERPASIDIFQGPRLLIRRLVNRQDRLMATAVTTPFVVKKDIYIFKLDDDESNLCFLLAILNSRLLSFAYLGKDVAATKDDFRQTTLEGLRSLPIRHIHFNTLEVERQRRVADLIAHYERGEHTALLAEVEALLPKNADDKFLAFQPGATGAEEKSDVVHDFLAYLAEQMIAMHQEKQARVDAFWADLEGAADPAAFETLRTKGKWEQSLAKDPACAPYVDVDSRSTRHLDESLGWDAACFEAFAAMLAGKRAVTPALGRVYVKHAPDYRALVRRIQETDHLIDQIVYRLYGLTEEEIAVVEGEE